MSLVSFQPSHSYATLARSATFPKCAAYVAQEQVRRILGHLARSNTLASTSSSKEEMAHETALQESTVDKLDQATLTATEDKKPELRECLECKQPVKDEPKTRNIDEEIEDRRHQLPPAPSPPLKVHRDFIHCMPLEAPVYRKFSVFTAGSIEMGAAVQWQQLIVSYLSDLPITVLNPRRGNWDPNDIPKADNEGFKGQVEWELDALSKANVICFFFDTTTRSPVTMLELGLWAASKKIVVCCDEKFWRAGNVELVCRRYKIPFVKKFEDLVPKVREMLVQKGMKLDENGDIIGPNVRPKDQEADELVDFHPGLEPSADEPPASEPLAGEPLAGEPLAGEPLAGESLAGEPLAGEPLADKS